MSKELEELKGISRNKIEYIKKQPKIDYVYLKYYEGVLDLISRLESIDNSNPSEALMFIQELLNISETEKHFINLANYEIRLNLIKIKQALIKAQEQENVLKIIFEKNVDIEFLKSADTFDEYNKLIEMSNIFSILLTQEEFNSIKEMLNND